MAQRRRHLAKLDRLHAQDETLLFFDEGKNETPWSRTLDKSPIFESNDMKLWRAALIFRMDDEKKAKMAPYKKAPPPPADAGRETVATIDAAVPHTRVRTQLRKRGRRISLAAIKGLANENDDADDDEGDDFLLTRKEIGALKAPTFERLMRKARRDACDWRFFPSCGAVFVASILTAALICGGGALGFILARDAHCGADADSKCIG